MIVKKDNKWLVMDSSGKKVLGTHYSKEEANDQLAAIEISKKRRSKVEESQKLLNNSMTNLTEYYKKLCEDLKIQRMVLEAKVKEEKEKKHKKKSGKKADKDYDGDGEVESDSKEYLGSRSNAIKKAVAKREGKELKESYLTEANLGSESGRRAYREQRLRDKDEFSSLRQDIRIKPQRPRPDWAGPEPSTIFPTGVLPRAGSSTLGPGKLRPLPNLRLPMSFDDPEGDDLDAMRKRGEEIGGVPAPEPVGDIMSMRRKAAEMGGITDDMVNEPLPGSSSLPGMDLTAQTPEQIDAANRGQTGVFGRPTTTGTARQPKSMSNVPTASPEAGKMMRPYAGDGLRRGQEPSSTDNDLAKRLLNYVSGRKEGKVRDSSGKLVDRDSQELVGKLNSPNSNNLFGTVRQSKPTLYADLMNGARRKMPGMNMFARMEEETNFKIDPNKSLVEATTKQLSDKQITPIDHLTYKNNTKIQLSENMIYGGFPQIKKA